ncbi:MAG: hypothetical protein OYI31_05915 [Chloroflexota bacterium]|nr:hypothetical protein [Chloroflexota bacterium]MDE2942124.1 hypothetical protein [Chloroflexota bacterium]MDE3267970.1 hypothetical protein [Chloroflexota bacterium]
MNRPELLDEARWREALSAASTEVSEDPIACELLAYRLAGQYLPALFSARRPEDRQRVWNALWSYMTLAPTKAKPFVLSSPAADGLIAAVQEELGRLGVDAV